MELLLRPPGCMLLDFAPDGDSCLAYIFCLEGVSSGIFLNKKEDVLSRGPLNSGGCSFRLRWPEPRQDSRLLQAYEEENKEFRAFQDPIIIMASSVLVFLSFWPTERA